MHLIDDGKNDSWGEVAGILFRRKWQIAVTFVAIAAGAILFTLSMPKQYETRLKILVKNERADSVVTADRTTGSGYRGEVSETEINSEIELLNSRDLLQLVVTKCGLERFELSDSSPASERNSIAVEKAVMRLQRDLKISPIRRADIIQVEYSARDPKLAVQVLRQLAESYLESHLKVHSTPGTYQFFNGETERYGGELRDRETQLADFRQRNNVVMLQPQKELLLQRTIDAGSALLAAESAIAEYTDKIAYTRKQLEAATPRITTQSRTVPNQYSVEHLGSLLAELRNQRTQLLAKFLPNDRVVQEIEKEVADTQEALNNAMALTGTEHSTDVNPLHQMLGIELAKEQAELAGMEARRAQLSAQARAYQGQLTKLDGVTPKWDDLVRGQKEAEDNHLLYKRKTEEARIAESLDQQKIANVAIAEAPIEPHLPSKPNVQLNIGVGVAAAAFLSLMFAFGAEFLQQHAHSDRNVQVAGRVTASPTGLLDSIETHEDLEALTGLSVLAIRRL